MEEPWDGIGVFSFAGWFCSTGWEGPAKAQVFLGISCGTQTSLCLYRGAEMPLLVQRPWMYQVYEDMVFFATPSFSWVPAWI